MASSRDPYEALPQLPEFDVTSTELQHGQTLPPAQRSGKMGIEGGLDQSPSALMVRVSAGDQEFRRHCTGPGRPYRKRILALGCLQPAGVNNVTALWGSGARSARRRHTAG